MSVSQEGQCPLQVVMSRPFLTVRCVQRALQIKSLFCVRFTVRVF